MKDADRAAFLSKSDLATGMVTEFTELQGEMGKEYALLDGEKPEVAQAIFEQYMPRFPEIFCRRNLSAVPFLWLTSWTTFLLPSLEV